MIMSTIEHSILVLRMINGDEPHDPTLTWSVVFAPLFGLAILAVTVMVWAVRFSKSFKFELFFTVNVVQFVFLALKLDNVVDWNWAIVFIPAWMVLAVCLIAVVYAVILAILLSRTMQMLPSHRRNHIFSALCHLCVVVPLLMFLLLLTGRLDAIEANNSTIPITTTPEPVSSDLSNLILTTTLSPLDAIPGLSTISIPLFFALALLTLLTFGSRGGNPWWFAMRKPFCNFIFGHSPCLQQYANISYKIGRSSSTEEHEPELLETLRHEEPVRQSRIMVPIETLEAPD
uniref:Transmembrane protein n=1 Tax=Steinernema glaseri TaxID=37863 RepID=A0A1I7YS82_9BILA